MIDNLGYAWTFEDVEKLTWPRWRALARRLKLHPPVHWLVAGFVGYKPPPEAPTPANFGEACAATASWFKAPQRFFK